MSKTDLADSIIAAVMGHQSVSSYCCQGAVDADDLRIVVGKETMIKLPLRPAAAKQLLAASVQAPYGQRTKTLVNKDVRDTLEIDGADVELSPGLQAAVDAAAMEAAAAMGLDEDRLRVDLYKLLIYPKGGFFAAHRDSEKHRGMVATLIIMLPNPYSGGQLIVRHQGQSTTCDFAEGVASQAIQYAAFFADCEHEVEKVRSGVRVCLAFNLILTPATRATAQKKKLAADPQVNRALRAWAESRPTDPIVVALEHQYTAAGLKPALFKGADVVQHQRFRQAASECGFEIHFGQVSRHLCQYADDGDFGYDRYRSRYRSSVVDYEQLNIGESYDDEIVIDGWKNCDGKRVSFPNLSCDESQLISTVPVEDWVPTSQDYEGYTGNAGNTLDRWYHKSAMVLWLQANSFDIYLEMGIEFAIAHFLELRAGLSEWHEDDIEEACEECQTAAEAIMGRWPSLASEEWNVSKEQSKSLAQFADELIKFDDPELIEQFLQMLHRQDVLFALNRFVPAASKRLGSDEIKPALLHLLGTTREPNRYGIVHCVGLAKRDAAWLSKLCQSKQRGGFSIDDLAEFLGVAIDQLQVNIGLAQERHRRRSGSSAALSIWIDLCKAALSIDHAQSVKTLFDSTEAAPSLFDFRDFGVDAAITLQAWSRKRLGEVPSALSGWIETIRQQLRSVTRDAPQPPTDFSRREVAECNCRLCSQLSIFLADPNESKTRIAARQDLRYHLENQIQSEQIDVVSELDRSGSPHALLLTKTNADHDRALQRYHTDLELLAKLDQL